MSRPQQLIPPTSVSDRDGDFESSTVDIYTGKFTKVTRNAVREAQPAWSPNGQKIAFETHSSLLTTDVKILVARADGRGTAMFVTSPVPGDTFAPSWRPAGGDEIAFYKNGDVKVRDLSVADVDPGAVRSITTDGQSYDDILPNWSPDGSRLVFQSNRRTADGTTDYEIYTARASDGNDRRRLTDNSFDEGDAAYSPSDARIVYNDFIFGTGDLLTINSTDGSHESAIVVGGTQDLSPDWGNAVPPPSGCTKAGTFFADIMTGTNAADTICSLAGNDRVDGLGGNDALKGAVGRDTLIGGSGRDKLLGSDGSDGVNGNDSLNGGPGTDRCVKDTREASVRNCP
jgi:dipeptidyl aminopeptidase/acylaminoacyl peptidase